MKKIILALAVCVASHYASAQQASNMCGTDAKYQEYLNTHPEAAEAQKKFNKEFAEYLKTIDINSLKASNTVMGKAGAPKYIIPVVFHIMHNNSFEYYSEAEIQQEIANMNAAYSGNNPYRSRIRPIFKDIEGNAQIEFRLAKKDPQGNCTNGIERIYVGALTDKANDQVKRNTWDPQRYLNIWTTASIESGGGFAAGGYAYFPTGIPSAKVDGLLVSNRSGVTPNPSNPNAAPFAIATCAHEAGHYLGLAHPFNNSQNDSCGDGDDIFDTPPTYFLPTNAANQAHNVCDSVPDYNSCGTDNPDLPDQYENIMDYFQGRCASTMFTLQQVARMHFTLDNYRRNLWSYDNLVSTGVLETTPPPCAPISAFSVSNNNSLEGAVACVGTSITFKDNSYNGAITSYLWDFGENATPQTSTLASPSVTYSTPGKKTVTLTTTNSIGSNTKSIPGFVTVGPAAAVRVNNNAQFADWDYKNNYLEEGWYYENEFPSNGWVRTTQTKYDGVASLKLNSSTLLTAFDYSLISPSFDFTGAAGPYFSFYYSYAPNFANPGSQKNIDSQDGLSVWTSVNCGKTWVRVKNIAPPNPVNGVYTAVNPLRSSTSAVVSGNDFYPVNKSQWSLVEVKGSVLIPSSSNVKFKITYSYQGGNNLFLDNLQVGYRTGLEEIKAEEFQFNVKPNPFSGLASVTYNMPVSGQVNIRLFDILGKEIANIFSGSQNSGDHEVMIDRNKYDIGSGIYFLKFRAGNSEVTKKVVIN